MNLDSRKLYEQIIDYIMGEIRSGELTPGDRVSSETVLAEQFKVSRITSKRALDVLRQAGVIERIQGKGSFVAYNLPDIINQFTGRSLVPARKSLSATIGLVIPDISEASGFQLLCAIEEQCAKRGVTLLVRRTRSQDDERKAVSTLTNMVDGLIVLPVHGDYYNTMLLRMILNSYPLVLVSSFLPGIRCCAVHTDDVAAAYTLTDYVLGLGHHTVAFVSPPLESLSSVKARLEGFLRAFHERGIQPNNQLLLIDLRSTTSGAYNPEAVAADVEKIRTLFIHEPHVTALVVSEYNLARLVAEVLEQEKMIACFDPPDDPINGTPFLHVRQDYRAMGERAVDLLIAQISGVNVPKRTTIPFKLIGPG